MISLEVVCNENLRNELGSALCLIVIKYFTIDNPVMIRITVDCVLWQQFGMFCQPFYVCFAGVSVIATADELMHKMRNRRRHPTGFTLDRNGPFDGWRDVKVCPNNLWRASLRIRTPLKVTLMFSLVCRLDHCQFFSLGNRREWVLCEESLHPGWRWVSKYP